MTRRCRDDRGDIAVEAAQLALPILVGLALIPYFGQQVVHGNAVEQAAADAARTASIARDAQTARVTAEEAARATLDQQNRSCRTLTVTVDTAGFAVPVGTPASVSATVTCRLEFAFKVPGLPSSKVVAAHAISPLDTNRPRG